MVKRSQQKQEHRKRQPGETGIFACVGQGTSEKPNDKKTFDDQENQFENQLMNWIIALGGIFAVVCLGGALYCDGVYNYVLSVSLLTMFAISIFAVYAAFLNSTKLYSLDSYNVNIRRIFSFVMASFFGGYCLMQVFWYKEATDNPVIVNSIVQQSVYSLGVQTITFLITPVYPNGAGVEQVQTYPVISLSGLTDRSECWERVIEDGEEPCDGKVLNESRLSLKWVKDNATTRHRVSAIIGSTSFASDQCDEFHNGDGHNREFVIADYVNCLPLYQDASDTCTNVYETSGTMVLPDKTDQSIDFTKKFMSGAFGVATSQISLRRSVISNTADEEGYSYSWTVTSCDEISNYNERMCAKGVAPCDAGCTIDTDCRAFCGRITDYVCSRSEFEGYFTMSMIDEYLFTESHVMEAIVAAFELGKTSGEVLFNVPTTTNALPSKGYFQFISYDTTRMREGAHICSISVDAKETVNAFVTAGSGFFTDFFCELFQLRGTVNYVSTSTEDQSNWNEDMLKLRERIQSWYAVPYPMIMLTQAVRDDGTIWDDQATYNVSIDNAWNHRNGKDNCDSTALRAHDPLINDITCYDVPEVDCEPSDEASALTCTDECGTVSYVGDPKAVGGGKECEGMYTCKPGDGDCPIPVPCHTDDDCHDPLFRCHDNPISTNPMYTCQESVDCVVDNTATRGLCTAECEAVAWEIAVPMQGRGRECPTNQYQCQPVSHMQPQG